MAGRALQPKYGATVQMFGALPSWLGVYDAERLASYSVYDRMYWNEPETYKITFRGDEDNPIYIPSSKAVIEACNRYLAVGFDYRMSGPDSDVVAARDAMDTLFRREEFWAKFSTNKRFGLVRGDAIWHITADDSKPVGRRISILDVDPGSFFPITADDDPDRIIGVHLVDMWPDPNDPKVNRIRRQTYRKEDNGRISSELTLWEEGKWDDRPNAAEPGKKAELKKVATLRPRFELPPLITSIPVYHIKNQRDTADPFGSSEIRGIERLASARTQAVSDMELALALQGLGVYWTNSGPPVDSVTGEPTEWIMGPGEVIEVKDGGDGKSSFNRLQGITTVEPYMDFLAYLDKWEKEAASTPDIAYGSIDVETAESGIALQWRMAPLLTKNKEVEDASLLPVYDHMFYDLLTAWMPAFEQLSFDETLNCVPVTGDPLPVNRKAVIDEVLALMSSDPPLITAEVGRMMLARKIGMEFPADLTQAVIEEQQDFADARDSFAARLRKEAGA
jgi:hypothetical protein